jgi:hypothetical protein
VFVARQPVAKGNSPEVTSAIDVSNPGDFRASRLALVEQDLAQARESGDEILIAALTKRAAELRLGGLRVNLLGYQMSYAFSISGPVTVTDPSGDLERRVRRTVPWTVNFWIGGWDADALQAYMRGSLTVPLTA